MATEQPTPSAAPAPAPAAAKSAGAREPNEFTVYQHSNIFYWWPIWFICFLFAAVTYFGDYHMAIVPPGTKAVSNVNVTDKDGNVIVDKAGKPLADRDVLVLAEKRNHLTKKDDAGVEKVIQPTIYVSRYRSLGSIFLFLLLIVIFITNITLRGQWSVIVLVSISALVIIFWLAGFWEFIFEKLDRLSIFINLGGYMMIGLVVFGLWLVNYFFFDKQVYVVFSPGNVRLCLELGAGETIYSTFGMVVQKKRSDLFRHYALGFGSGDLIIRFPRVDHAIELHNILRIGDVLKRIESLGEAAPPTPPAADSNRPAAPPAPPKAT